MAPMTTCKKPFAPIDCAVQMHVKPNARLSWDTRSEPGFNLGTSMEQHQCFRVYVMRTRATRISNTIIFKQQYITSPTISPESHVVAAGQQLVMALQGNIPAGNQTAEALTRVSKLFTKIASAKKRGCQSKRVEKQTPGKPLGMDYNSPSKGGSTTSKGGRASSKMDQSHSG
jgi:hypothetical protein